MATAVDAAIVELQAALAAALPVQEGLADYQRLNLLAPAKADVNAEKIIVDRRVTRLQAALAGCQGIVDDGYPEIPTRQVEADVLADLQDQAATIAAALAKFSPALAANLNLDAAAPTFK